MNHGWRPSRGDGDADALTRRLLEESQLGEADFVVRPQAKVKHFADFSDPAGLIASGERAAEETLPQIAGVLERHHSLFVRRAAVTRGERAWRPHPRAPGVG